MAVEVKEAVSLLWVPALVGDVWHGILPLYGKANHLGRER